MSSPENTSRKQAQDRSNLITRIVTALIGGPLVLYITYLGGLPFILIGLVLAVLSLLEFYAMGHQRHMQGHTLIGLPAVVALVLLFSNQDYSWCLLLVIVAAGVAWLFDQQRGTVEGRQAQVMMTVGGLLYAGLPPAFLIQIRALPDGLLWIYLIFVLTWSTDSFAYFGGRLWGKHRLAPHISPKKTVEGAIVGVIGGSALGLLLALAANRFTPALLPLLLVAPPLAVTGDLFESWLKRRFHVGDSHLSGLNIIPGHGGVLDRTDSLVWVTTLFYLLVALAGVGS